MEKIKNAILKKDDFKYRIILIMFIFMIMMILLIKNLYALNRFNNYNIKMVFGLIFILIAMVESVNLFLILKYKKKFENLIEENETLKLYNKSITESNDIVRGFKHDFANFLIALEGLADEENISGIKHMVKNSMQSTISANIQLELNPNVINNSALYNLIIKKYFLAKEKNITVQIENVIDLSFDSNNLEDVVRILGILLDNAIEAACESKEKMLIISFTKTDELKEIIIENSYDNKDIDIGQIFEKGFSSKNYEKEEHGLGLYNVRKILEKNTTLNLITKCDKYFSQTLDIYAIS